MNPIAANVYKQHSDVYTDNFSRGKVYGEKIVKIGDKEFRHWDPTRSKLAAAICNGLKDLPLEGWKILYLGASTGTTVSHVSDIIRDNGIIYAIEFSERVFRSLLEMSKSRKNIVPMIADARKPETYRWIELVDAVYVDIAQPDETEIALRNSNSFLKKGGLMFLAVKSQSIDVTKKPQEVYETEKGKLQSSGFSVMQLINLEPYEDKHAMIVARKN